MPDVREVFEAATAPPEPGARERQHRRQTRAVRNHRIGAMAVTAAIVTVIGVVALALSSGQHAGPRVGDSPTAHATTPTEDDTYLLPVGDGVPTLLPSPLDGTSYRFSPDGSHIAFTALDTSGRQHVYAMDPGGTGIYVVTDMDFLDEWALEPDEPSWSPDGEWLVVSGRDLYTGRLGLYFMSVDGHPPPRSGFARGSEPAWSPDGRAIAFTSMEDSEPKIRIVRPRGYARGASMTISGRAKTILARASSPSWSQDGTRIAFVATDSQLVSIADADGTNVRAITDGPSAHPAWSPDGASIAYDDLSSGRIAIYDVATQETSYLDAAACTQGWADAATLLVTTECDV